MNKLLDFAIDQLLEALATYYESGEYVKPFKRKEIADCVIKYAAAGGVASMAGGVLPGVGSAIAIAIATGAVWAMYIKLSKMIGITLKKEMLKIVASVAVSNIVINLGGLIMGGVAVSLIPGAGIVSGGIISFAMTYIAGILFLRVLTGLFKANYSNWNDLSEEELKASVQSAAKYVDLRAVFMEAKSVFKEMRKDGTLNQAADGTDINPEDDL